jgi:hypothetical protein
MQATVSKITLMTAQDTTEIQNLDPGCTFDLGGQDYMICVNPSGGQDVTAIRFDDTSVHILNCNTNVMPTALRLTTTLPQ